MISLRFCWFSVAIVFFICQVKTIESLLTFPPHRGVTHTATTTIIKIHRNVLSHHDPARTMHINDSSSLLFGVSKSRDNTKRRTSLLSKSKVILSLSKSIIDDNNNTLLINNNNDNRNSEDLSWSSSIQGYDTDESKYSKNSDTDSESLSEEEEAAASLLSSSSSDINNENDNHNSNNESSTISSWSDWSTSASSLGSFLLKRKKMEEEEMKKRGGGGEEGKITEGGNYKLPDVQKEFDQTIKTIASEAEGTFVSFIDLTKGTGGSKKDNKDEYKKKTKQRKGKRFNDIDDLQGLDENIVREVDESINLLSAPQEILKKDIEVLTMPITIEQPTVEILETDDGITPTLPLSDEAHTARIEKDMRHLAVSIASTIEDAEQWKTFMEDGGGVLPLLECIRDGAKEIEKGPWEKDVRDEGMVGLVEQREEAFAAACTACKTLRDLCAISKPFAAIITDSILRADAAWSTPVQNKDKQTYLEGGIISNLITLLRFSQEADLLYNRRSRQQKIRALRNKGVQRLGNRRQRRIARKRCGLYVTQLLLEMAFASDKAVDTFRVTTGFTDTVLSCSSYAQVERLRRRWVRYPIEVVKRFFSSKGSEIENKESPFLAAASMNSGISGLIQGSSNQLLAAMGNNIWYPKTPGQRGLRILCLDGGGTRGITAISSMRSIVNALGGIEVCDAFDMIVGTSTGAIIAFLVGLRRESSALARKRYDRLIKKIFVKSALSTPMLLFTTATYDETPFNNVVGEILRDNSMLSSRADPRVPLVFAISSKMSSSPTQICLFRNYNYGGGEMRDTFVQDAIDAKKELGIELEDDIYKLSRMLCYDGVSKIAKKTSVGSRHPGSFRVLQRAALRATTAAPTVFKPVLMGGELYCDGGIVASNPAAVAIHEARTIYPNIPIELVVSCGTGAFIEEKSEPRIGWDGIIGQIVNSATDGEQVHHILEDILGGQGSTTKLGSSYVSRTRYYRFQPIVGTPDAFPIDGTDPIKLEELSQLTTDYMNEPEQQRKLNEIVDLLKGKRGWKRRLLSKIGI